MLRVSKGETQSKALLPPDGPPCPYTPQAGPQDPCEMPEMPVAWPSLTADALPSPHILQPVGVGTAGEILISPLLISTAGRTSRQGQEEVRGQGPNLQTTQSPEPCVPPNKPCSKQIIFVVPGKSASTYPCN